MSGETMQLFAQLAKVDVEKRQVTGVIASEHVDPAGEIFDYDSSKPNFEKWSGNVAKMSGGKSVGNVRAMHGNVAAGTLSEIAFDDVAKTITVVADIVDDNEWNKVLKGVYTGFSIGGKYLKKWADKTIAKAKRYTADPSEVSIVDIGCNPAATFTMCKADGVETEVKFEDTVAGIMSKLLDSATDPAELPALSLALAKAHGNDIPVSTEGEGEELEKGAYTIGELARLADSVRCFCSYDAIAYQPDGSTTPRTFAPELKAAATALYDALLKLVSEDVAEAKEKLKAMKKALDDEGEEVLRKSAELHEVEHATLGDIYKAFGIEEGALHSTALETITKAIGDAAAATTKLSEETAAHEVTKTELQKFKDAPAPAKGVKTLVVGKEDDGSIAKSDSAPPVDKDGKPDPIALMKSAQARPLTIHANGALQK